jgi:hypothetical protein
VFARSFILDIGRKNYSTALLYFFLTLAHQAEQILYELFKDINFQMGYDHKMELFQSIL